MSNSQEVKSHSSLQVRKTVNAQKLRSNCSSQEQLKGKFEATSPWFNMWQINMNSLKYDSNIQATHTPSDKG